MKQEDRHKLNLAIFSIFLGVGLLALKYYAYLLTGSKAILSDALESIVNVVAAVLLFGSLKFALAPFPLNTLLENITVPCTF